MTIKILLYVEDVHKTNGEKPKFNFIQETVDGGTFILNFVIEVGVNKPQIGRILCKHLGTTRSLVRSPKSSILFCIKCINLCISFWGLKFL